MKKSIILLSLIALISPTADAQDNSAVLPADWTLQSAIEYARAHNLDVRQQEVTTRGSRYFLRQSQLGQIPHLSFNTNYGRSLGTNIDPATNTYTKSSYNYFTFSGTASVLLFGWLQQRNTILKNRAALSASEANLQQAKDEVMWNVCTAYLRVLLSWEQTKVNEKQVQTTQAQIGQAAKFVKAGALPDLSLAQLQAQLAGDSAQLIKSTSELNASVVDIKALLNLPQSATFNVTPPDGDELAKVDMSLADAETIYDVAEKRLGAVRAAGYNLDAARHGLAAAKGANLPQLSFNASAGTAYSSSVYNYTPTGTIVSKDPINYVSPDGTHGAYYPVLNTYSTKTVAFSDQVRDLYHTTYYLNLTLPLFNGWSGSYNVRQARLNLEQQELAQDEVRVHLRQEVYKAHNDARNAIQTYVAARRASEATKRALSYGQARLFVGMTNVTDYLQIFNTYYVAQSRLLQAKYDMFFRVKLVDFYMGRDLRL